MGKMTSFFLVVVMAIICQFNVKSNDDCIRLSAAFHYDDVTYLVHGNNYIAIDSDFTEVSNGTLEEEFNGLEGSVQAATVYADDDTLYFFEGNNYLYYYWGSIWGPDENSDWSPFYVGGIDAAGTIGGTSYFFKQCAFVEDDGSANIRDNIDLGLPCDLDSAWGVGGKMYITKGNEYWVMDADKIVTGPHDLADLLTLTTTSICEEKENPYVAKIRAEQKYEKENECVIIDAAITWQDKVYLFNDDEYVRLDDDGNEDRLESIYKWGGQPGNIDAGIVWASNGVTYFFKGPSYYRYSWLTLGPFGNDLWGPFFEQGIDAAGNHNGKSYFFKGCEMSHYEGTDEDQSQIFDVKDIGLPCDVDAAFSRANTLYVIKRNQVWTLRADAETATGPAPLSTIAQLTSWEACEP